MKLFFRSRVIEWILVAWGSYWLIAPFAPIALVFTVINGILMALWLGILIAYWRGTWTAVRDSRNPLGGQLVMVGIAGLAVSIMAIFTWGWFYQFYMQPVWMRDSLFRGWISWIFLVSTMVLLIATTVEEKTLIPADSWKRVGTVAAMAVMLTLALIYTIGGFERY